MCNCPDSPDHFPLEDDRTLIAPVSKDPVRYSKADVARCMQNIFTELMVLRQAGQAEYAHRDDRPFRNFEESADDFGLTRLTALLHYAKKHWDGIIAYAKGHKSQREDVRGRINDMILYLMIARAMIDEEAGIIYVGTEPLPEHDPEAAQRHVRTLADRFQVVEIRENKDGVSLTIFDTVTSLFFTPVLRNFHESRD